MDQLSNLLASNFSLTSGESNLVAANPRHAANPSAAYDLSLIGKVLTDKDLSLNFIRANALRLLHPVRGAEIRSIGMNTFVIKFNHPLDRTKALRGCPWVLDKYALLIEPINPSQRPEDQEIIWLPIIVRVHQLSLINRSEEVASLIGNQLGEFVEVPKESDGYYSPFLRIKIRVDVTQPLKRGITFQGVEGTRQWLPVAYERLPLFCFLCGILGHGEIDCPKRYEDGFTEPEGELPYGSWLRVVTGDRDITGSRRSGSRQRAIARMAAPRRPGGRTGSEIFTFGTRGGGQLSTKENLHPNFVPGSGRGQGGDGRKEAYVLSEGSGESIAKDKRKKVLVVSKKRKVAELVQGVDPILEKKSVLQLRDEDNLSTAATAEQSRRSQ